MQQVAAKVDGWLRPSQTPLTTPYSRYSCEEGQHHQHLSMLTLLQVAAKDDGWLSPITNTLDYTLQQIQTGLDQLHVPYSYGWAIIGLTVATKIVTFPFTKVQVCLPQVPLPLS